MSVSDSLLAQRFGYGPRAGRMPMRATAAQLAGPDPAITAFPMRGTDAALAQMADWRERERARKEGDDSSRNARRTISRETEVWYMVNARTDLARAVEAKDSYRERLVRFWSDHFSVTARKAPQRSLISAMSEDAIRPNVAAPFAQMLRAAIMHPAMILYLNQSDSVGPQSAAGKRKEAGLNENLARELLELHTLGVDGPYDQTDVRQAALLLTGVTVDGNRGATFGPRRAEPGAETVLGKRYGGAKQARIEDVYQFLDDLSVHPATARHIAGKLAVHFVSDTPDPALVAELTEVWMRTGGDLGAVSHALVTHPAALRPTLEKARQPYDFMVAALRALDVPGKDILRWNDAYLQRAVLNPMTRMGQRWQTASGPDGWEEGFDYWVTPQALALRIDWAMTRPSQLRDTLPDPRDFVQLALGDLADDTLISLVSRAERKAEGIGLVLASPQFNRR